MKSISAYLNEDYKKWGDNPYIHTCENGVFQAHTFRETIEDVWNVSKELCVQGFAGKNIYLYGENSYEWMVLYLSAMGYVGQCVPVDKEWTAYDVENTLSVLPAAVFFYSESKKECVGQLQEKYPDVTYICMQQEFRNLADSGAKRNVELVGETDLDKTVMILFTSGTTNVPKAIPLTQANLFHNWDTLYKRTPMTEADVSYVMLPLNHVYSGVANFLYSIISGMQLYLCSDLNKMLPEMLAIRPTVVCMVPLILKRVYGVINDTILDMLRDIRFLYCGGSFTDFEIKEYFIKQGVHLLEAYGTTETSSVIALDVLGDENITSNGVIFENLEVKILDPDEKGVGEILVKGGSVSEGYLWRNDRNSEFDEQGFYHTGDLGRIDETRHLYLTGRKRRMIITANGKNVYVDEIEALLLENPMIKTAKVYEENYHVTASVVSDLTEKEVWDYVSQINQNLPKFKRIHKVYTRQDVLGGRIK